MQDLSSLGFQVDPDLSIHWIAPKMLWIHSLVGVSHFVKFCENQPMDV